MILFNIQSTDNKHIHIIFALKSYGSDYINEHWHDCANKILNTMYSTLYQIYLITTFSSNGIYN